MRKVVPDWGSQGNVNCPWPFLNPADRSVALARELLHNTLSLEYAQVLGAHAWVNAVTCQKRLPSVVTAALIVLIENGLTLMHMQRLQGLSQLTPRMLGALSNV